jgi:hypothetical protein
MTIVIVKLGEDSTLKAVAPVRFRSGVLIQNAQWTLRAYGAVLRNATSARRDLLDSPSLRSDELARNLPVRGR